jgi:hypothetical protein
MLPTIEATLDASEMRVTDALAFLPPSKQALDLLLAGIAEGMSVVDALAFAWSQYEATKQQYPQFIRGIR